MRVGLVMYSSIIDTYLVAKDPLKLNNQINIFLISPSNILYYF